MTKTLRIPASTQVNPADFTRTLRRIKVPVDFSIDDVMVPGAWANLHDRIHLDDELIIWREDHAWRVHLLVVDRGIGFITTVQLHQWVRDDAPAEEEPIGEPLAVPEGYIVNHAPKTGWRVLTKEPHLEVSRNHTSKLHAIQAAVEHAAKANGSQAAA